MHMYIYMIGVYGHLGIAILGDQLGQMGSRSIVYIILAGGVGVVAILGQCYENFLLMNVAC